MGRKKETPGQKQSKTKIAKNRFEKWYHVGATATTRDGSTTITVVEGERFKPYPKKKSHYVSNLGHIVSFLDEQPQLIKQTPDRQYFRNADGWLHLVQAEAFKDEVEVYGKGAEPGGQLHHERLGTEENHSLEYLNDIDYEEKVSKRIHDFLTWLQYNPVAERTLSDEFKNMLRLGKLAISEEPNRITLVIDHGAEQTSIHARDSIAFTSSGMYYLTIPDTHKDGVKLKKRYKTPGKSEELHSIISNIIKETKLPIFSFTHDGINMTIAVITVR